MKYFAFIVLGLVLLAMICYVVLWANMPTAKLTVHAVRPMGTNVSWAPSRGKELSWPVWEFAITNSGRGPADWSRMVLTKDAEGVTFYTPPVDPWAFFARLPPGQCTNTFIPVPSDSTKLWTVEVLYNTPESSLERRLRSLCTPLPKLRRLLPNIGNHLALDTWHATTNVTTAH